MTPFEVLRNQMVEQQLKGRGLQDQRLLAVFAKVPRHLFVPEEVRSAAYEDRPLPIGAGQTISQPYIVALMTQALHLEGHERVLEIGTGSGYQTAILAELVLEVFSIERVPELLKNVDETLQHVGYHNVYLSVGDGSLGWLDHAPYDAIMVSAAAPRFPPPLLEQLNDPGRLVIPIGSRDSQTLMCVERRGGLLRQRELTNCVFVPLLGTHGWEDTRDAP